MLLIPHNRTGNTFHDAMLCGIFPHEHTSGRNCRIMVTQIDSLLGAFHWTKPEVRILDYHYRMSKADRRGPAGSGGATTVSPRNWLTKLSNREAVLTRVSNSIKRGHRRMKRPCSLARTLPKADVIGPYMTNRRVSPSCTQPPNFRYGAGGAKTYAKSRTPLVSCSKGTLNSRQRKTRTRAFLHDAGE